MVHFALLALCAAIAAEAPEPSSPVSAEVRPMQPVAVPSFVTGPTLEPVEALRSWLEAQGAASPRPLLRLPVSVAWPPVDPLAAPRAWIGADPEALGVRLDDGALGVGLQERLRGLCPEGAEPCRVWLLGTWGPLLPLPGEEAVPTLAVRGVQGLVQEGDEIRAFVGE
jgi:hypothetical protein